MEIDRPRLVSNPHPLIGDGRVLSYAEFEHGETLRAYIERTGVIVPDGDVAVWHNGYRVPDALWERLIPRTGDQVVIRARVHGGGGGILKIVAMIAILVVAVSISGGSLAPLLGSAFAAGTTGAIAASVVFSVGASLLLNALIPPPKPTLPELSNGAAKQNNPTYSIAGASNQARQWQPMTLIFGRHKVVPDAAGKAYTEFVGEDQYLNQAFHFGLQGPFLEIVDIRLGDTPINNYQAVQLQRAGPDGKLTMFPGNVDSLQGFELKSSDGWIYRTTPINTSHIKVEFSAQLYFYTDTGAFEARSAIYEFQYRNVNDPQWYAVGSFDNPAVYATHYWSKIERIQIEFAGDSGGIGDADGAQIEYGSINYGDHTDGEQGTTPEGVNFIWRWKPHPHTLGQPWAGIAPDPLITAPITINAIKVSNNKTEPLRFQAEASVPVGQYEVRIKKFTFDISTSKESNSTVVNQILCYQPDTGDYTGQARLGVRIKATSQLQGQIQNMSAICSAQCLAWFPPVGWITTKTSNPAWWFLWYARGGRDSAGNRLYGGNLTDDQIDIEGIKAWALFCDQKSLTFNYVLSQRTTVHDVLTMIARAGRAAYTWQTGKIGVVWDAANLPVVAMIGPYNIVAGSFSVSYVNDQTADEIVMTFINPDRNWERDTVRVQVPNVVQNNNVAQLDLDGCTNANMAAREANLIAASQAFHRRRVSWEMDPEGVIITRGDVVQFSHDLTAWSYSGRLISGNRTSITLDQSVPSDGAGWASLRAPDGQIVLVQVTSATGDVNVLNLIGLPGSFPVPSENPTIPALDWAFQFDPLATPGRRIKIVDVKPTGDNFQFTGIDDYEGYYLSENNPFAYTPPRDGVLLIGLVLDITFSESVAVAAEDLISVTASWTTTANSTTHRVNWAINGVPQLAFNTQNRSHTFTARTNDVITYSVTPVSNVGNGSARTESHKVVGLLFPLPPVVNLTNIWRDTLTVLKWDAVRDVRDPAYEVRIGPSWTNSRTVAITRDTDIYAVGNGLYWVAARFATPWGLVLYGPPDSLLVSGASIVRNVLVTVDEHPDWDGDLIDGAYRFGDILTLAPRGDILALENIFLPDDLLWTDGCEDFGIYETNTANIIDVGSVQPIKIDFNVVEYALNFNENVLSFVDVFAETDVLNDSNRQFYKAQPQIRYAGEDGVYGNWVDYVPSLINARYFDVRLYLSTQDPLIVPFVEEFTWVVDVPDRIQKAENVTIPSGGLTITYPKPFNAVPNLQIAVFDAVNGDRYVLSSSTKTSFTIQLFNVSTAVARQINWLAQGY